MTTHKNKCSACGTSPINHTLLFILSLLEETLGSLHDKIFNVKTKKWQEATNSLEKILFTVFETVGLVRFSNDIEKACTGRSKLIWEEARMQGIEMEQVVILGKPIENYRAIINNKLFYFTSLPIPISLKQDGYKWLDDKFRLFQELNSKEISAPESRKIFTWKSAQKAFSEMQKPVIIKPKFGSRGRHTTTNINTKEELKKAFDLAREITVCIVMQEHLFGNVYRATVINNKLVGFFRGDTPEVIGNGVKTVKELITEKNKNRNEKLSEIIINNDLINFIDRLGYNLDSVPDTGITLKLSAKTGRMYGGYTEEMLPTVHPKMHEIFKKAGEIVSAPVVGFDLIIENPIKDPALQRWGIIECNSLPFIDLHYFALEGTPINLAKNVWNLWK